MLAEQRSSWSYTAAQASPHFIEEVPIDGWKGLVKAVLDRLVAALLLLLCAPTFLVVAIALRLDQGGPVLYRQLRIGYRGTPFAMLKFRTLRTKSQSHTDTDWDASTDPRLTKVGRFLRLTSLDELPQLWSVVRGDMSFVGPRPKPPGAISGADEDDLRLLLMRPGITGLGTLLGGSGEQARAFDLWYIDNWSLGLDATVVSRTILAVLGRTTSRGPWTLDLK